MRSQDTDFLHMLSESMRLAGEPMSHMEAQGKGAVPSEGGSGTIRVEHRVSHLRNAAQTNRLLKHIISEK